MAIGGRVADGIVDPVCRYAVLPLEINDALEGGQYLQGYQQNREVVQYMGFRTQTPPMSNKTTFGRFCDAIVYHRSILRKPKS